MVAALGLALAERLLGDATPGALRLARRLQPAGGLAAAASLALEPGPASGLLAAAWLAVCLCATVAGLAVAVATGRTAPTRDTLGHLTVAVGLVYLGVGGAWLMISRLAWRPLDLSTDIVRLTAVHFHYAAFGVAILAAAGLASVDWLASAVSLVTGCVAALVSPPLVALGFVLDSAVGQIGGAVGMTVAAWAVGFGTFLVSTSTSALAPPTGDGPSATPLRHDVARQAGRTLLVVSALSPILPMLLAVQWALAQHTAMPGLSIDAMASTHGVLNGLGFVVAGLAGWLLTGLPARGAPTPAADVAG